MILISGLFVAVVIYPILHEAGHIIVMLITGIKIEEISLFNGFSILCRINSTEKINAVVAGYGGILFPVIVSFITNPKSFVLWYMLFVLKIINLISVVFSFCSLGTHYLGIPLEHNDISAILKIDSMSFSPTVVFLAVCFIVIILLFLKDEPLKHFDNFYFVEE